MVGLRQARSVSVILAAVALAVVAIGCGGGAASTAPPAGATSPTVRATSTATASRPPAAVIETTPPADESPAAETLPAPDASPPGADATPAGEGSAAPTADPGPGAICSGSADNKSWWSAAAAKMAWDVYCPVLPGGWHIANGTWAAANGGRIAATYSGPGGARLELNEGNFCTAGLSACSAHDQVVGTVAFGDRAASLDTLGPGLGYAIYIDPGRPRSWSLSGTGLSQASFTAIAAALAKVAKA